LLAHPDFKVGNGGRDRSRRTKSRCSGVLPLMLRSISNSMSIRRTASLAIGASPCFTLSHSHISVALWEKAGFPIDRRADGGGGWLWSDMDWGDLAIAAWKKGGPAACGVGGPSGLLRAPPWR
jgi:hypothetical protein